MADETSLSGILSSFTAATDSAIRTLPEVDTLLPPENGISLLDAKNEIFLSYLQALALRNLNVIRFLKNGAVFEDVQELSDKITSKLVEHRVYLDRGVRPLEQKIKYQVDRVVKAADDQNRAASQHSKRTKAINGHANGNADATSESEDDSEAEEEDVAAVNATAYKPNLAGFGQQSNANIEQRGRSENTTDGVYRPPRVSATSMPTTEQREQRKERRPPRSATLDEYVNTELSNAPLAEPSIGSTIAAGGRRDKDTRTLTKEKERRNYEETNLMRLPSESKKELAKQRARERNGAFGGEEWQGLGESVDRIGDLTRKKGKDTALDKSRKRRTVEDGPRGNGIGDAFDVKKRRVMKKMRR